MGFTKRIKKTFIAGFFVLIPLLVTVYIVYVIISSIDSIISPLIKNIIINLTGKEIYIPGTGFIIFIIITYLTGILTSNYFGKKLLFYGELILHRIPFVKGIYRSLKDIFNTFSFESTRAFKEVVMVEMPLNGKFFIGFITKRFTLKDGRQLCNVFIPTTPNPTSGFLIVAREEELIFLEMTPEEAIKYIVSLGLTQTDISWREKNL
ncbi:MAG: DUF502 domain-containing protein [Syntrophorhabdaceae bacterium]|nr:DUF502 domain-containing protein [Syntrophorhabdaceae bacterium]